MTAKEALEYARIALWSTRGVEAFAGAGTTGVVAKEAGREFLGIELNPEYVALAERRIAQASYQPKLEGLCRDR